MSTTTGRIVKYGATWAAHTNPLKIELECIRFGGRWRTARGIECGEGLFHHYMSARKMLWPRRYRHRWTDLIYKEVLENKVTILMGPASCQKSGSLSELACITYWASPQNTAILVTSTTKDKMQGGIFSEITMLWQEGKLRYPTLAGFPIEYKMMITTDDIDVVEVRDFRKGILCKPCFKGSTTSSSNYIGLGVFAGIKQENMWLLADELQFMAPTFLDCITNLRSNPNFKVVGSGNPNHDPESQLSIAAAPLEGWGSVEENTKTSVWPIKLYGGKCVNLIGTDSPNLDQDEDIYPKLIGREFIKITAHDEGIGSAAYESQVMGRNKMALAKSRVITREICREGHAHDAALWKGTTRTMIHACDPAYGGGDRCISMRAEFGEAADGTAILRVFAPRIVKINLAMKDTLSPEDQIAISIKQELDYFKIPPTHSVYDSFGKGTVGNAFAKVFGHNCPTPINAGERPTKRPVRHDLYVIDEHTNEKRHKRCDEEYGKFITELWFSVRRLIEAGQMRELPLDVMAEGCRREYYTVAGNKTDVEPKEEMGGRSPDLFDTLALLVECARRQGFRIERLGVKVDVKADDDDYLARESERYRTVIRSNMLTEV